MNTTGIQLIKELLQYSRTPKNLMEMLGIKNWQLNAHIKELTKKDLVEKVNGKFQLKEVAKITQLRNVAKKFDIEKLLHESNEHILSFLIDPLEINALIVSSGLSKATVYRAISDLESIGAIKKEHDVVGIEKANNSLLMFATLLKADRESKTKKQSDKEKIKEQKKSQKLTFDDLKNHLWGAADILRGSLDANEYRQPIMTILFLKRLNDQFEEHARNLEAEGKNKQTAWEDPDRHPFFIPKEARWNEIANTFENIGEKIDKICSLIERTNPVLEGVLTNISYNDKKRYPDDVLLELASHFNERKLGNSDLVNEDIFGQGYEYLLEKFADSAGKKAGEFFTPREVVHLLIKLLKPKEKMKICDPAVGSGGMLIWSRKHIREEGGNPKNISLHGQERNYGNYGMCKMNMILHGIENFRIEHENVITNPLLIENGKLLDYDLVLANYPFSMEWKNSEATNDPYNRFEFGVPPKNYADFAFILHIHKILNEKGKAGIISSLGVLYRVGEEEKIRKELIKLDHIEAIIELPANLFYATGIPACVLVLNKNKDQKRKNKILFVYAAKEFFNAGQRDLLRSQDIEKIANAFESFDEMERYSHVADLTEIEENNFNLNVSRYIDIFEPEPDVNILEKSKTISKAEKEKQELDEELNQFLSEIE